MKTLCIIFLYAIGIMVFFLPSMFMSLRKLSTEFHYMHCHTIIIGVLLSISCFGVASSLLLGVYSLEFTPYLENIFFKEKSYDIKELDERSLTGTSIVHINRAAYFLSYEEYKKAIGEYEKALELNPQFAEAYNGIGFSYEALGKYEEALRSYKKAVELKPDYAIAYNNMAILYKSLGLYAKALEYFQKAIDLEPLVPDAYYNTGELYCDLGFPEKGEEYFRQALKYFQERGDQEDIEAVKRRIRMLRID